MRPRAILLTALSCLFVVSPPAASAPIEPTKEADIRRLIELSKANEQIAHMKPLLSQQMRPLINQMLLASLPPENRDPELVGRYADRFVQLFMERFETDEIIKRMIPIYDKYYTHEEIKGIIHFLESPLGKRLIEVSPQIMQESFKTGSQYGEEIGRQIGLEIAHEMREELRRRERELEEEYPELRLVRQENLAAGSLRTIVTAAITYFATYNNGFPLDLQTLGPPPEGEASSCQHADILDQVLASGETQGYRFEYQPGTPLASPAPGCAAPGAESFTVVARPLEYGKDGRRSYFVDESFVIRYTTEDRPATADDPILQ